MPDCRNYSLSELTPPIAPTQLHIYSINAKVTFMAAVRGQVSYEDFLGIALRKSNYRRFQNQLNRFISSRYFLKLSCDSSSFVQQLCSNFLSWTDRIRYIRANRVAEQRSVEQAFVFQDLQIPLRSVTIGHSMVFLARSERYKIPLDPNFLLKICLCRSAIVIFTFFWELKLLKKKRDIKKNRFHFCFLFISFLIFYLLLCKKENLWMWSRSAVTSTQSSKKTTLNQPHWRTKTGIIRI